MREMHLIVWLTIICCEAKSRIDNNNKGIECTESERDALLEFKRGINVDHCGVLDSWGVTQDCCLWQGIKCHNLSGHIIALSLHTPYDDNQETCLDGTISVSILDLKHLKYLDLSYNRFQGQIPKFIGSLANLEYLNLSYAGFTGTIPREIGNLSRLTSLDLNSIIHYDSGYTMRVESLQWLSQLTLLREVDLGGIDLSVATNSWLSTVNSLPFLHVLRCDYCNLSLKLPSSLSYVNSSTNLATISLYGNNLNDTSIFKWLSNLDGVNTNIVYLDLSDNQQLFENNFQPSVYAMKFLGSLCSLKTLKLSNTNLNYDFSDIIQSLSLCSHKSLVYLHLAFNQIWGSIPDNTSNLYNLRELNIPSNQLNGTISPGAFGKLSMLEFLSLPSNYLKGVLTSTHLSNLSKLSVLNLAYSTELVVNISSYWIPPFQLDTLYLSSCKVGPDFPMWLITQKNLTTIDISNTSISGIIPDSFFNSLSSKLMSLSMSQNMMYGVLPDVSITFEASPRIDLSSNNFSGTIPLFLRNVSVLHLNNNHLSKGLLPFLCPQTKMTIVSLDLSNNLFLEKLPDCWAHFDKLLVLHLENNKFSGNLPFSMGSLNQLKALHLSSNNLSGELPASLLNCTSLIILDLAHNSLSGYIPFVLGKVLKDLSIIILRDNNFFGTLPSSLCHLSRLQMLDFSNNRLGGTIPRCIDNLKGMVSTESLLQDIVLVFLPASMTTENYDNALIMWKGKEQYFVDDYLLGHNKVLDFSNNILEGQIPEEISNLTGLKQINLSRNHLSGVITPKIGQLVSLESLDLSHNHISGEIPVGLAKISSLGVLDLSYNNLSGRIPDGTQLQSFNTSAYMGNPGLCGAPLPKCDGDEAAIIPKNLDNEQPGDNFMVGVYISVVLGFIFGFWGVCGTLVVKSSWRHAFFQFYDDIKDKIYVVVITNVQRVWRRT